MHSFGARTPTMKRLPDIAFFAISLSMCCARNISIDPLSNAGGLYLQHLGPAYMSSDYWEIVTYFDVTFFEEKLRFSMQRIDDFRDVCKNTTSPYACPRAMAELLREYHRLERAHNELRSSMSTHRARRRRRRSIFNGGHRIWVPVITTSGGPAYTSDYYDAAIDARLNYSQTTASRMTIIRTEHTALDQRIEALDEVRVKLDDHLEMMTDLSRQGLLRTSHLIKYIEHMWLDSKATRDQFELLAKVMFYQKADVVVSGLLPEDLVVRELRQVETTIDDIRFPLPVYGLNAAKLIELAKFYPFFSETKIIFVLQVPIVRELFDLYRVWPVPGMVESTGEQFDIVMPTLPYFARTKQQYALMRNLDNCQSIAGEKLTCENYLVYNSSEASVCETELLARSKLPQICKKRRFEGRVELLQRLSHSQWLFASNRAWELEVECEGSLLNVTLHKVGFLNLPSNCTISHGNMTHDDRESQTTIVQLTDLYVTTEYLLQSNGINVASFTNQSFVQFLLDLTVGFNNHRFSSEIALGADAIFEIGLRVLGTLMGALFLYVTWQLLITLRRQNKYT